MLNPKDNLRFEYIGSRVPRILKEQAETYAQTYDMTVSQLVRQAITEMLKRDRNGRPREWSIR